MFTKRAREEITRTEDVEKELTNDYKAIDLGEVQMELDT